MFLNTVHRFFRNSVSIGHHDHYIYCSAVLCSWRASMLALTLALLLLVLLVPNSLCLYWLLAYLYFRRPVK